MQSRYDGTTARSVLRLRTAATPASGSITRKYLTPVRAQMSIIASIAPGSLTPNDVL
jgi:hypothetical protein